MSLTATDIIVPAAAELMDPTYTRWSLAMHYRFVTEAVRATILTVPGSNAITEALTLTANTTLQAIPAAGLQLIDVTRNMGDDGLTPGEPITIIDRNTLDTTLSTWHSATGSDDIDHFSFDIRNPTSFYVTPPPNTGRYVEMTYSGTQATVTALADALTVLDNYEPAILEFHLYKAFSINHASLADWQKATDHLRNFFLLLGEVEKAKLLYNPDQES